jgi:hypothetical protein
MRNNTRLILLNITGCILFLALPLLFAQLVEVCKDAGAGMRGWICVLASCALSNQFMQIILTVAMKTERISE